MLRACVAGNSHVEQDEHDDLEDEGEDEDQDEDGSQDLGSQDTPPTKKRPNPSVLSNLPQK